MVRSYQSFGEIFIDFLDKSPYTDYSKELELSEEEKSKVILTGIRALAERDFE